ncbi:MAG: xanthine dehydrogenase family protein molybdopterin-binding subunit [Pirellulales bacterium]
MVEYTWPDRKDSTVLGGSHDKIDGPFKCTGTAKYSYDINPPKVLLARGLGCSLAHCKVKNIDIAAAEKIPGVVAVRVLKKAGDEVQWQGELVACVVGETEGAVAEGLGAIKADYEPLDVFVNEEDLAAAEAAKRTTKGPGKVQLENEPGDDEDEAAFEQKEIDRLFKEAAAVVEGRYGIRAITHMCLEPHGSTCDWKDGKLTAHLSTQNVSGTAGQFGGPLGITADDVTVHCDYIGGGFGSKFAADSWGVLAAKLSQELGRPVKLMLDRDQELKIAGSRPSGFADIKVGANSEGVITIWDSHQWSTGGPAGGALSQEVVPYVIVPKNFRRRTTNVKTNTGPTRAWRAPNHPQGCAMSQTAIDDVAAKLGMDSYDVFLRNLVNVPKERASVYEEEMKIGAKIMDWKAKWHPHGKGKANGSIVTGLGMAIHTWQGAGHGSSCRVNIHPDGGVETFLGSQDLGTGTRTVIATVLAETFGLPISGVKVNIGSSKYPPSGPSGGSTTVGGVSESSRHAGLDALAQLNAKVAEKLGCSADNLVAKNGRISDKTDAKKSLSWKEACSLLGMTPLEVTSRGAPGPKSKLSSSGVGGVQMAEVAVDRETGVVKMKKFVTVQDMGLVVNRKTAESQIYGAMIMGIAFALFEERIMDAKTGAFLNAEVADYRLPRLGDIGELVVEIYEPDEQRARGVIGLGEPPVIGPGAAISNAVANALGVRVPVLPMTPKQVLDTLKARNA